MAKYSFYLERGIPKGCYWHETIGESYVAVGDVIQITLVNDIVLKGVLYGFLPVNFDKSCIGVYKSDIPLGSCVDILILNNIIIPMMVIKDIHIIGIGAGHKSHCIHLGVLK